MKENAILLHKLINKVIYSFNLNITNIKNLLEMSNEELELLLRLN